MKNNNKILTLSIILLLTLTTIYVSAASIAPVKAADTATYIQKYTINDGTTGDFIYSNDLTTGSTSGNLQISNGQELRVTVTIKIPTSNPSSSLILSTGMAHPSGDHYWALDPSSGYSLGPYNPNSATFSFPQTAGTFTITCLGVASGTVATSAGGITLHKSIPIVLVALKDPSGTTLDEIKANVTDASINEYNTKLNDAENKLAGLGGADPSWTSLAQNVIDASKTVAEQGLTDNAIAMLDSLNNASAPASGALQILFIPLIAIFAVLAGLFGFMFMRNRSKVSYFRMVVEDQIKDLEGLTLRASKIDRTMASNLDGVKDRLKRLVGM
jgi:hypothetical protein